MQTGGQMRVVTEQQFWIEEFLYWRAYARAGGCAWVPRMGQC